MADETGPTEPAERRVDLDGAPAGGGGVLRTQAPAEPAWANAEASWPLVDAGTTGQRRRYRRAVRFESADGDAMGDWAWVEEWRRGGEPTPWGPGLFLATFAGLIIGCAVYVISTGLADTLWLALAANVVVAAGLTPALWMSRTLPVLRWVGLGGALGTVIAWISLLFFPHF